MAGPRGPWPLQTLGVAPPMSATGTISHNYIVQCKEVRLSVCLYITFSHVLLTVSTRSLATTFQRCIHVRACLLRADKQISDVI